MGEVRTTVTLDEEVLLAAKVRAADVDPARRSPARQGTDKTVVVAAEPRRAGYRHIPVRRNHLDPAARSYICHPDVVGHDAFEVVSEVESRREVQHVQAAQVSGSRRPELSKTRVPTGNSATASSRTHAYRGARLAAHSPPLFGPSRCRTEASPSGQRQW